MGHNLTFEIECYCSKLENGKSPPPLNLILILCEAYEVGWDFVIALEQKQQWQPHQNHAASHTGEGPSCCTFNVAWTFILMFQFVRQLFVDNCALNSS